MILGVADDLLTADEQRNHYLTKIGGTPWAPSEIAKGLPESGWQAASQCGVCGRPLSLVLQASLYSG